MQTLILLIIFVEISGCPKCNEVWSPICGSDENTYKSECAMRYQVCVSQHAVTKEYDGVCKGKFLNILSWKPYDC